MKLITALFVFALSYSAFSSEILTCSIGPKQKIKIMKKEGKYFYTTNGKRPTSLAKAVTIQAADVKKEPLILEIMDLIGMKKSDLDRVNFYQLTANDDGGLSILRFIDKNSMYLAISVTMGGVHPCE